jgi:hypothetical protein
VADFATVLRDELECIKHRRTMLIDEASGESMPRGDRAAALGEEYATRGVKVAAMVIPDTTESKDPRPRQPSAQGGQSAATAARLRALDMHIAGLAISGGGIRSATFALGVIQALAHLQLPNSSTRRSSKVIAHRATTRRTT